LIFAAPSSPRSVTMSALADRALLATWMFEPDTLDQAQPALALARELDDPSLLARALSAAAT
jgi:hypothetical protein